jgi:hypothetical protein
MGDLSPQQHAALSKKLNQLIAQLEATVEAADLKVP